MEGGSPKEVIGSPTLKELLAEAALSPSLAIRDATAIELGEVGREAEELHDRTMVDPQKRERAKWVIVTPDGRVLLQKKESIGSQRFEINGPLIDVSKFVKPQLRVPIFERVDAKLRPRWQRWSLFRGMLVHTHGDIEGPFSPDDLYGLFLTEQDFKASPGVMAVTKEKKLLIFRSRDTPQWQEDELQEKIKRWNFQLSQRLESHLTADMSDQEQQGIIARANHALIRQIAYKYHLRMYSCNISENIAKPDSA